MNNFEDSINWLYSFKQYGSKLGLERIAYLVDQLGDPQNNFNVIHVTGTNGKGSVCKFIGSILHKAGYKTGVYISPHLQRFSERIVINNEEISEKSVSLTVGEIKPVVEDMIKQGNTPTFFEIVTAMAFQYFSDCSVDYAIVEVGLGGRSDATNVVSPKVSVITNISLEHSDKLGEDVRSIAFEKAGIIKNCIPIITAAKNSARKVIEEVAAEKNAPITVMDSKKWKRLYSNTSSQEFLITGMFKDYTVNTSLLGEFQGENIALAIAAVEQLQMNGVYITNNDIEDGISTTLHPGRMEIIAEQPTVLLDGAHNPVGIEMLKKTLKEDFEYDKLILVIGILKDKDIQKMLSTLVPVSDIIITVKSNNPRACEPKTLKDKIQKLGLEKKVFIKDSISEAIEKAKSLANKKDMICVSGSLFTVGEARSYLLTRSSEEIN